MKVAVLKERRPYEARVAATPDSVKKLIGLGFTGEILVLAPPLLRPKMVESELRGLARGKTLRLIAGVLPPLSEV